MTIKTPALSNSADLLVYVRPTASKISLSETSKVRSYPACSSATRSTLMSNPITDRFLLNSTAKGRPTYPRPIIAIILESKFILYLKIIVCILDHCILRTPHSSSYGPQLDQQKWAFWTPIGGHLLFERPFLHGVPPCFPLSSKGLTKDAAISEISKTCVIPDCQAIGSLRPIMPVYCFKCVTYKKSHPLKFAAQ